MVKNKLKEIMRIKQAKKITPQIKANIDFLTKLK